MEYNAEADHKYLVGSKGEYYASYRVPSIDADAIRFVRVSVRFHHVFITFLACFSRFHHAFLSQAMYCVPGYPCQTDTGPGGLWKHESAQNIAGSPRFAILLGSPNHLVANASMSGATGPVSTNFIRQQRVSPPAATCLSAAACLIHFRVTGRRRQV